MPRAARPWLAALAAFALAACSSTGMAPGGAAPVEAADAARAELEGAGARSAALEAPLSAPDAEAERAVADDSRAERRARRRTDREGAGGESAAETADVPLRAADAYARAIEAMAVGNWLEAELELEQLVLEFADYPGPYVNLAIVYMNDGRDADARTALGEALAIAPAHAAANNQLGIVLRRDGDFTGAEAAYRRAIEADPDYVLAYYNLGVLLDLYMRRQSEALDYYERYQDALEAPDERVARWIIDLRRRVGAGDRAERVAQEDGA